MELPLSAQPAGAGSSLNGVDVLTVTHQVKSVYPELQQPHEPKYQPLEELSSQAY
eukprot:m.8908 g.8908  ORF g.8908 m.8908 type:complete len:55 (-) comp9313_c0_seq5:270-434(-)